MSALIGSIPSPRHHSHPVVYVVAYKLALKLVTTGLDSGRTTRLIRLRRQLLGEG